nr:hypothetical protein [Tanacetum cinerariifolium]
NPFRNRMFPHIEAKVSVKLSDVIDILDKMRKRSLALEDNDAIWILEAIPATHRYVHKQPTEKISSALAWELRIPFSWSRCCTLFVGDQLAPPLKILTPTKVESETDWWKASLEYFEGKHVQSEVVSEPLEIEKDGISEKKRKRGSSQLRVRRTPLKLKSPMRCYSRKMRCTIPPPASTTMPPVTTISVPMTTTK